MLIIIYLKYSSSFRQSYSSILFAFFENLNKYTCERHFKIELRKKVGLRENNLEKNTKAFLKYF